MCPWRIRSRRFGVVNHESDLSEPIGVGDDDPGSIPLVAQLFWA
jgi:hypothetical protein